MSSENLEMTKEGSSSSSPPSSTPNAGGEPSSNGGAPPLPVHSNFVPAQLDRHLEFLDFSTEEGHLILGCSNLTGRYWGGSLWYYKNPEEAPSVQHALTGVDCDNGMVDGFFINNAAVGSSSSASKENKNMVIALDNGSVEHVNLNYMEASGTEGTSEGGVSSGGFYCMERVVSAQEHDDIITGLTRTPDQIITCSYDKSIVIMDLNTLALISRFDNAHSDLISAVSANALNPNVIASAGSDGKVSSWDVREKSVISSALYSNKDSWPTAVEWSPQEDNILLIGSQSGEIGIYDTRNPKVPISIDKSIDQQIYKFKFSPFAPDTFAVSADTFPVRIFEIPKCNFKIIYEDERHEDFVRGLAWHPKTEKLWTCGWDHKVYCHEISDT